MRTICFAKRICSFILICVLLFCVLPAAVFAESIDDGIQSVTVSGIGEPTEYEKVEDFVSCITVASDAPYTIDHIEVNGYAVHEGDRFEEGKEYIISVFLSAKGDAFFPYTKVTNTLYYPYAGTVSGDQVSSAGVKYNDRKILRVVSVRLQAKEQTDDAKKPHHALVSYDTFRYRYYLAYEGETIYIEAPEPAYGTEFDHWESWISWDEYEYVTFADAYAAQRLLSCLRKKSLYLEAISS